MNTQELQLCSFEQAKALRDLGFNWKVYHWYNSDGTLSNSINAHNRNRGYSISAPSVALALKWMRDVKGIRNGIAPTSIMCYSGWFSGDEDTNAIFQGSWCNDYDFEASCLLDEIIKHLKSQEK